MDYSNDDDNNDDIDDNNILLIGHSLSDQSNITYFFYFICLALV